MLSRLTTSNFFSIVRNRFLLKTGEYKEILTPLTDLLALLGTSTIGINQLMQDLMKQICRLT